MAIPMDVSKRWRQQHIQRLDFIMRSPLTKTAKSNGVSHKQWATLQHKAGAVLRRDFS